jgi:hypothetical protein
MCRASLCLETNEFLKIKIIQFVSWVSAGAGKLEFGSVPKKKTGDKRDVVR